MAENEETSKRVATIASKILGMEKAPLLITKEFWEEIKTLAGSALTQTADKTKNPLAKEFIANEIAKRKLLPRKEVLDPTLAAAAGIFDLKKLIDSKKK